MTVKKAFLVDITGLPEDLVAAAVEGADRPLPADWRDRLARGCAARDKRKRKRRQARAEALREILGPPARQRSNVPKGRAEAILGQLSDWLSYHELRQRVDMPRGSVKATLGKLYARGAIDRKENPQAAENRLGAFGVAACKWLYRRSGD